MNRPASIVTFERAYLAAIVIGIVNTVLSWSQVNAMLDDPAIKAAGIGTGALIFSVVLGIIIPLVLWYFIARRASNVARWIFVVLTALGVFGFLASLANPMVPKGLGTVLGTLGVGLQIYAAWLLFRPDAVAWLEGGAAAGPADPTTFD